MPGVSFFGIESGRPAVSALSDEVIGVGRPVCWRCNKAMIWLNIRWFAKAEYGGIVLDPLDVNRVGRGGKAVLRQASDSDTKKKRKSYHHEGMQSVVLDRLSKSSANRR